MRKPSRRMAVAFCAASLMLTGCQQGAGNSLEGNEQLVGGVVGAGLGALLGSQFGSGSGQLAATVIGTLAGAYLGSQIAARLTPEDKEQHAEAVEEALNEPVAAEPVVWRNPNTGNAGVVDPGEPYIVPASNAGAEAERTCRPVVQTVTLADGETEQTEVTWCRTPDGRWTIET